ncbi:MAG: zinc ribbon domain-containing protein [Clostridia bacterium]|nr:zinc ribbon domain-containing protein [Clostridia bacterium]
MENKKNVNMTWVSFILILMFLTLTFAYFGIWKDNSQIKITKEFTISSTTEEWLITDYTTTITGVVKNNTNKTLDDIILIFDVQTNFLNIKGVLESEKFSLQPNETKTIKIVSETGENFETINNISYNYNNNIVTLTKNNTVLNIIIIAILAFLAFILILCLSPSPEPQQLKNKQTTTQTTVTNSNETPIINITNTINTNNNDDIINNLKAEQDNLKNQLKTYTEQKYCKYCGRKNINNKSTCNFCGAPLED